MLNKYDDLPLHQTADPFGIAFVDDSRWFDRYWFMTGSVEERVALITGIGTYPNAGKLDSYAMLCDGESQWSLRVGTGRRDEPLELIAGDLAFAIEDPMERWKLALTDRQEVGFDLTWDAGYPANELPKLQVERDGDVRLEMGHFSQAGTMSGSLRWGERSFGLSDWLSERDHSWGRRTPSGAVRRGLHVWLPGQAGDRSVWLWFREDADGRRLGMEGFVRDKSGAMARVAEVEHRIEAVEEVAPHRQLHHAELTLRLDDGSAVEVAVDPVCPVFISGGGYVGGKEAQGTFDGENVVRYDLGDGRAEIPYTIIDHFSRVTIDGIPGQGVFELCIGEYKPLGFGLPDTGELT